MAEFSLRPATPGDLTDIIRLEALGFAEGDQESADVYAERIEVFPPGSLMAMDGDTCIGCFFAEVWQDKPAYGAEDFQLGHSIRAAHDLTAGNCLYVASMTIDPQYRGDGHGARLFRAGVTRLVADYPQLRSVVLLVNETWHRARSIYAGAGFTEVTRLPAFFEPAPNCLQTGIVMKHTI